MFLQRTRSSRLGSLTILLVVYYIGFLAYVNIAPGSVHDTGGEEFNANQEANNHTHDENPKSNVSWIDHLCPRYRLAKEPGHKLMKELPVGGNIFFTQTSCRTHFNAREACAIESASYHHPHRNIQVFMTAPAINHTHPFVEILMKMDKVRLSWMDLDGIFQDPYLSSWHQQRMWLYHEIHAPAYVSDAARVVILYHYGGTYIDLDAITLRPLPNVTNFLGRLDEKQINLAVSSFTKGHELINMIRKRISSKFDSGKGTSIGPALLTKCLHRYCPESIPQIQKNDSGALEFCNDITIYPVKYFYPVSFNVEPAIKIFETGQGYGPQFFQSSDAYSLHLFSSLTPLLKAKKGSDSILEEAFKRNCPKVYETALKFKLEL